MLGSRNSAATKLRDKSPFMLNVHSIALRFPKSTGEVPNKVPSVRRFVDTLTLLALFL